MSLLHFAICWGEGLCIYQSLLHSTVQLMCQAAYFLAVVLDLYITWAATKLMSSQQTGASGSSLHSWYSLELGEMRRLHTLPALFHHLGKGEFHLFILHRFLPHSTHMAFWYVSCVFFPEFYWRSVLVQSVEISVIFVYDNELFLWSYGCVMCIILPEYKVHKSSVLYQACVSAWRCCM